MKFYFVYILQCSDNSLYTGITNDVSRRIEEHQKGLNKDCYTFNKRPLELIFSQEFNDVEQAISFEKKIKKWSRVKKLALTKGAVEELKILSECKNETHSKNKGLDSARPDNNRFNFSCQKIISKNQQIYLPILEEKHIELWIKREDEIHPEVSGNKFRKLKYNIQEAQQLGSDTILTFGGAYSNHILATAVAANISGLNSIGIIRGDELGKNLEKTLSSNETLKKASENGMKFHFVSRENYRQKSNPEFIKNLENRFGDFYLVPEGGTNNLAIKGCEEILSEKDRSFDIITTCVGTGGTISGLINSSKSNQKILGFPALKGDFLNDEIRKFTQKKNWELVTDFHFGGYAKYSEELIRFINEFKHQTSIQLDPIYTGKMFFGLLELIKNDYFRIGTKILAIHSGGLQGIAGCNQRLQQKNAEYRIEI